MYNVSFNEFIVAHFNYWKNFFSMLNSMRKTYKNSTKILLEILKNKFPIETELKSGKKIILKTFQGMYFELFIKNYNNVDYDFANDLVQIQNINLEEVNKNIKFFGGVNNGDIINGFLGMDYNSISVKNKTIIDIGANIGDTPIYFICSGAKNVVGIEPFPKNFELAKKNIEVNNMKEKIQLVNAGCASKKGFIKIDPDISNTISTIDEVSNGKKIPLLTIDNIIKEYHILDNSILKIDCEGCEYDIIKNLSKNSFQKFSDIFVEYHNGYKELKKILEKERFRVKITKPVATNVINSIFGLINNHTKKNKIGYVGFIHATKIVHENSPKS